jgi:predicted DNA-binding transcriptional regulator AlpA
MTAENRQEAETEISAPDKSGPQRMLNEQQVLAIIPVSRTTLFRMMKAGRFPKAIYISPNRRCWFESEVVAWQQALGERNPNFDPARGRGKGRRRVSASPSKQHHKLGPNGARLIWAGFFLVKANPLSDWSL